jgi:SAM-dependent methyltransferase
MKAETTEDVLTLLDGGFLAAAVGAAMELGLFWLLEPEPRDAGWIASELGIPPGNRCRYWLELLREGGLLDRAGDRYALSDTARAAIVESYDRQSWALLAEESRQRLTALNDLPQQLCSPGTATATEVGVSQDYVQLMSEDADRARRFTRMLYQIHGQWAAELAGRLDMAGVTRLMDLGGGSGVVSMALARRHPELTAVVVDVGNVCRAGRELASECGLEERVSYHPADFLRDELPSGFDAVLECDVNVYGEELVRKVHGALEPGGRYLIVDLFAAAPGEPPPTRVHWSLEHAMADPEFRYQAVGEVCALLEAAGFEVRTRGDQLPTLGAAGRYTTGWRVIEAVRP